MYHIKKQLKKIIVTSILLITINKLEAQTISDDALTMNINPNSTALKSILKLEPRVYEYNTNKIKTLNLKNGRQYGFTVANMEGVFPHLVSSRNHQYMFGKNTYRDARIQTISEVGLIPVLVASIQEMHYEIEQLKIQVAELKKNK